MKNIFKITTILLVLLVWSCEQDDSGANEDLVVTPTQVTVSFTDQNDGTVLLEDGGAVTLEVTLDEALTYDSILTLEVTSSDGSIETTPGVMEVAFTPVANLAAGETSASFDFVFSDDTITDGTEVYTVSIANLESASGAYAINRFITGADITRTITAVEGDLPLTVVTTAGDVNVLLEWATAEDLDLYLRDEPGFDGGNPNIATSWFSQPESMPIAGGLADGTYYIGVDSFLDTAPFGVACTLTLTFPDATAEVLLTELNDFIWIQVDKSTNGSVVTYTIFN